MIMMMNRFMKIVEAEEPGEPEPAKPEWIRNPGVQITVVRRWRIIRHDRRALIGIIIIDCRWFIILRIVLRRRSFSIGLFGSCILTLAFRFDG